MFVCDKCGLCCKHVGSSQLYQALDRGDGVCTYYDDASRLCAIYESRPLLCNVDKMYEEYFCRQMSKEEYYKRNYEACTQLKKKEAGE